MKYQLRKGTSKSPYYEVRFTYEGKRYTRSTKSKTAREAKKKALQIISDMIASKKYPKTLGSKTLNQALESRGEFPHNERLNIERVRQLNPKLFNVPMATITTDDLWAMKQKYAKRKNRYGNTIKGQSVNRPFKVIYSTFNEAKKWGWIDTVPYFREVAESRPIPRKALTKDQWKIIKDTCYQIDDEPLWWIFCTFLNTGLRRDELQGLLREHVAYDGEAILLPDQKNGDFNQEFTINDKAKEMIEKAMRSHNQAGVFDFTNFRKRYERVFSEAQIKTDIHSLRHTAITELAKVCDSLLDLSLFSRHKTLSQLKRYVHLVNKDYQKGVVNKINLD